MRKATKIMKLTKQIVHEQLKTLWFVGVVSVLCHAILFFEFQKMFIAITLVLNFRNLRIT